MDLKSTKVELFKNNTRLSEIYQSTGFKYAFLSSPQEGLKQCHPWVKCRDFLNDAVRNQLAGRNDQIYGFTYTPGENPVIDTKRMRMLVKRDVKNACENTPDETKEMMLSAFAIIRCFERHGGVKPITKLEVMEQDKNIYVFTGASDWVLSPFMISLYTFLIRLGAKKIKFKKREELNEALKKIAEQPEVYGDNDIVYLKQVLPHLDKIIKKRAMLGYEQPGGKKLMEASRIDTFHNYTGIVALCKPAVNITELRALSAEVLKE